jgi:FkbM family methyltransferase
MKRYIIDQLKQTKIYIKLETIKKKWFPTAYDKLQLTFIEAQLAFYRSLIKPNDLCFDVGGNMGVKTNIFLLLKARVLTLEPQRKCAHYLKNKYGKKITLLEKGVGASNEVKDFYVSNNTALSSFNQNWLAELQHGRFAGNTVHFIDRVEIITLDSLIETYGIPNFIKIDVEGYEKEVLKGLTRKFKSLSFEYTVPEKINEALACLQILKSNYRALTCNYTVCDENSFRLDNWLPIDVMIEYVKSDAFSSTFAGDIYVNNA